MSTSNPRSDNRPHPVLPGSPGSGLAHAIDREAVMPDLQTLVGNAIQTIEATQPAPDAILGGFVRLTSLCRSVSFHEGKLLEAALIRLAEANPDLLVLSQGLRLPLTKAAVEAVANNPVEKLRSLTLDSEVAARACYTPDLVIVDRARSSAMLLDMKRSIVSYADTNRLEELKAKMMAAALILPDWLYRERKRLYVDQVAIGIVDGASSTSDHDNGIWRLADIDGLIDVEGAAAAMDAMRHQFGARVQRLLREEARLALTQARETMVGRSSDPRIRKGWAKAFDQHARRSPIFGGPLDPVDEDPRDGEPADDRIGEAEDDDVVEGGPVRFGFLRAARTH